MHIGEYKVKSNIDMTLALVSDLHEYDPDEVIEALWVIKPQAIFLAGDFFEFYSFRPSSGKVRPEGFIAELDRRIYYFNEGLRRLVGRLAGEKQNRGPGNVWRLFDEALKIAPTFYSPGNHEWYMDDEDRAAIRKSGVMLLENQEVSFGDILVGGFGMEPDFGWAEAFASKEEFKILLCHQPEIARRLADKNIDLILSGHAHGGQIRFGGRGVIAPGQGFLPKYIKGQYGNLIVSAGCSNTVAVPRLGNPKEVVAIKLELDNG